jgi:hypothetical protein
LAFAIFMALNPSVAVGKQGNGWTSGGGDGVVCFASEREKLNSINSDGKLRPSALPLIESIRSLDLFQSERRFDFVNRFYGTKESLYSRLTGVSRAEMRVISQDIHQLSHYPYEYLGLLSPNFTTALEVIRRSGRFSSWKFRNHRLDDIQDTGDVVQIDDRRCMLVQLARRNFRLIEGRPEIEIQLDLPLWLRLHPVDKMALVLHEEIYVAAGLLRHVDSLSTRKLVAYLLSDDFHLLGRGSGNPMNFAVTPITVERQIFQSQLRELGLSNYMEILFAFNSSVRHFTNAITRLRENLENADRFSPGGDHEAVTLRLGYLRQHLSNESAYLFYLTSAYRRASSFGNLLTSRGVFVRDGGQSASVAALEAFLQSGNEFVISEKNYGCSDIPLDLNAQNHRQDLSQNFGAQHLVAILFKAQNFCNTSENSSGN